MTLDLSKYFGTLKHTRLLNILREDVKDERVIQMIKRYLKSGVMENGVVMETEEGSPQGGNLSPLLANIFLNELDWEYAKRASERLMESSIRYLEEKLKLTVNKDKSRAVSVFTIRNFKYLCFSLGRDQSSIFIRDHAKSMKKFRERLRDLSSRRSVQSIKPSLEEKKIYVRGWLNCYGIASRKNQIDEINGWLYHLT